MVADWYPRVVPAGYTGFVADVPSSSGSGGSGGGTADPEVFNVSGSGSPSNVTDVPVSGKGIAYNQAGNFWVYNGGWQQQY